MHFIKNDMNLTAASQLSSILIHIQRYGIFFKYARKISVLIDIHPRVDINI